MFEQDNDGGYWIPENLAYYGEVTFTMQYKNRKSKPFEWLYIDYQTLENASELTNFNCKLVSEGKHYDYLARLTVK